MVNYQYIIKSKAKKLIKFSNIQDPEGVIAVIEYINQNKDKFSIKGKDGRDGINALSNGIKDIQLVNNELIITLDDNTIKTITMPTIKQAIGKVGGISKHSVQVMIDEALNSAVGSDSYTKDESDAKYQAKTDENLFIQDNLPTLATGKQALWIDTSNGDIQFNLVIGE